MLEQNRNQDATVYIGNIDERVNDTLLWELMLQAGPVSNVHLPKDRVTQMHQGFAFCEFMTEADADYAIKVMTMVKLFGKPIRVNKATSDKKEMDIGATLFIGNLDPDVDEKLLYDTFSAFGVLISTPKVGRDVEAGVSKGFGFICYDNFENADHAIEAMNGQYLANKVITVSYAFKKDGKGEKHGSASERLLAAQAKKNLPQVNRNANFQPIPPPSAYQQRVPPPNVGGFTPQFPQQSGFPPQIGFPPHIGFPLQGNFNPPY